MRRLPILSGAVKTRKIWQITSVSLYKYSKNWKIWKNVAPIRTALGQFLVGEFFFRLKTEIFLLLQACYCPVKGKKQSPLFTEWIRLLSERYSDQFSAYREKQLREFRTSSFFILFLEKKSWWNRAPILINCHISDYTVKKWASPKFSQLLLSISRKLVWVPLRE